MMAGLGFVLKPTSTGYTGCSPPGKEESRGEKNVQAGTRLR